MNTEVYIPEVLQDVASKMKVIDPAHSPALFAINYEPGSQAQIIESLKTKDYGHLGALKYPLLAVVAPLPARNTPIGWEVVFPRISIAYYTKTSTETETVMSKYSSDGVFKKILRPCFREFIKYLAFSTYTAMGDPDAYEYTVREYPAPQELGDGTTDFVDIIEILSLKAIFYSQIKSC